MNQINVTTKKFTDAVKIDIGQLPVTDVKIDFNLTDGSNPVIAENKTFSMTIGTVNGELYKTDDDTVSYRYLKFDDNNVANSLAITMKMNGEEILNDTVSLTYQTSGGGSSVTVDSEMSESSPNPVANSTLTPIINAKADKATTIAGYGITDAYTKTEIDAKVSSVYHYKGTVSAYAGLPASGQEVGDVWNIETADSTHGIKAGDNVAWTGTEWDVLAGEIDLSAYATKTELETKLDSPAVAGTVGQVLTKTADGQEWADAPAGGGGEDTTDYLCFTADKANSTVRLDKSGTPTEINLEYSVDKKHWTEYTWSDKTGATITLANVGDSVWWRGDNTTFSSINNYYLFNMTGSIEASGNTMSLLDKTCRSVTIPTEYCFYYLFSWNSALKTAPELPAMTLAQSCYYFMFNQCNSLTKAPELPAMTLARTCYASMFVGCDSLTKAPELPATILAQSCYDYMFYQCNSLTKAPELPATTMADYCYHNMFYGCTNLKKIKVNFTSWTTGTSNNWLNNVSSTGVFECPSALDCSIRDNSHVPAGWTIVRTDAPKSITSPTTASSEATYQVSPNTPSVPVVTVSSALTLNANTIDSGSVTYTEIVLDVATGATVTAGSNLTLVDTPTAGKRNICVCRWSEGVCKLYVTIVEDLPQA